MGGFQKILHKLKGWVRQKSYIYLLTNVDGWVKKTLKCAYLVYKWSLKKELLLLFDYYGRLRLKNEKAGQQ